jgi:tetratricopeptide (TPR) repeat protein
MFEHRLYLPSIGAIIAVASAAAYALEKQNSQICISGKAAACIIFVVTVPLSYATYERNKVWKSELTLWNDAIAKKPGNPRAYNLVGGYYQANFRIYDAIPYFQKALEVDSTFAGARSNLGNAYVMTGRIDEGLNQLILAVNTGRFDALDTGILLYNIGKAFNLKGMTDKAEDYLNRAIRYNPNEAAIYFLLGSIYKQKNLVSQSTDYYKKAHELAPGKY